PFFLGGVKGFHAQRLETAKGLIDLLQRAEGASFVYRQPSHSGLYHCPERGLQWRLKAALAPRITTEPTRTAHRTAAIAYRSYRFLAGIGQCRKQILRS